MFCGLESFCFLGVWKIRFIEGVLVRLLFFGKSLVVWWVVLIAGVFLMEYFVVMGFIKVIVVFMVVIKIISYVMIIFYLLRKD